MFQLKLERLQLIMLYVFRSTMSKHLRRLPYLYLISKIKIQERHSVQFETFFSFFPFLNLDRNDFSRQQLLAINKRCLDGKKTLRIFREAAIKSFPFSLYCCLIHFLSSLLLPSPRGNISLLQYVQPSLPPFPLSPHPSLLPAFSLVCVRGVSCVNTYGIPGIHSGPARDRFKSQTGIWDLGLDVYISSPNILFLSSIFSSIFFLFLLSFALPD